jgi:hypothetical protein
MNNQKIDDEWEQYVAKPDDEWEQYAQGQAPQDLLTHIKNILSNAPSGIEQGILGAGDAIRNMLLTPGRLGEVAGIIPKGATERLQRPTGQGTAYNVGNIAGDIAGFLGGGEALEAGRAATEALPYLGKASQYLGQEGLLPGALKRAIPTSIYVASENVQNPLKGALTGAGLSLAGETIPLAAKGIGKLAEQVNPLQETKNISDYIAQNFNKYKNESKKNYDTVLDSIGNDTFFPSRYISKVDPDDVKNFVSEKSKKLIKEFDNNPTFENAHDLQSQLGSDTAKLNRGRPDAATQRSIDIMNDYRTDLKNDMFDYAGSINPDLRDTYQKASDIHRDFIVPVQSNKILNNAAKGKTDFITPQNLNKALGKTNENVNLLPGHYLEDALKQSAWSSNKAKIANAMTSLGLGGILGGILGSPSTGLVGGAASLVATPKVLELAQMPEVINALEKAYPGYKNLIAGLKGAIL